jgi:hypothetical protein
MHGLVILDSQKVPNKALPKSTSGLQFDRYLFFMILQFPSS